MEKETNKVGAFKQFAEKELKNHLAELNTRYQKESLSSHELKQQAYKEQQKNFNKELEDKIKSLLSTQNSWLKDELENFKHAFVTKLIYNISFLSH